MKADKLIWINWVHIQNRIVAFVQQHVNQEQVSAKIKAGFCY